MYPLLRASVPWYSPGAGGSNFTEKGIIMQDHRFVSRAKGGKKGARGQTKKIRQGSTRTPVLKSGRARGQGSRRNPF